MRVFRALVTAAVVCASACRGAYCQPVVVTTESQSEVKPNATDHYYAVQDYCETLSSDASSYLSLRASGWAFSWAVESAIAKKSEPQQQKDSELVLFHHMWDDHTTPDNQVPGRVRAACIKFNGSPAMPKPHLECMALAVQLLHTIEAHMDAHSTLEQTEADVTQDGSIAQQEYSIKMTQFAYENHSMQENDFMRVAFATCHDNPQVSALPDTK